MEGNGGNPRCTIKLDIKKAFSVNWQFILNVLQYMRFPPFFISWIKERISTPGYSLRLNGSLEGFILGGKGVRQGDPLFPYLFILCMEVLSKMLIAAAAEGLLPYHPRCKN